MIFLGLNENFCKILKWPLQREHATRHNSPNAKIADRMFFKTFCFVYFELTLSKNNGKIKGRHLKSGVNQ